MDRELSLALVNVIGGGSGIITVTYDGICMVPETSNRNWSPIYCRLSPTDEQTVILSLEPIPEKMVQLLKEEESVNDTWEVQLEDLWELQQDDEDALPKLVDLLSNRISLFESEESLISALRYLQFSKRISLERAFLELEAMSAEETERLVAEVKEQKGRRLS